VCGCVAGQPNTHWPKTIDHWPSAVHHPVSVVWALPASVAHVRVHVQSRPLIEQLACGDGSAAGQPPSVEPTPSSTGISWLCRVVASVFPAHAGRIAYATSASAPIIP
jgi:hypothetical protein